MLLLRCALDKVSTSVLSHWCKRSSKKEQKELGPKCLGQGKWCFWKVVCRLLLFKIYGLEKHDHGLSGWYVNSNNNAHSFSFA